MTSASPLELDAYRDGREAEEIDVGVSEARRIADPALRRAWRRGWLESRKSRKKNQTNRSD